MHKRLLVPFVWAFIIVSMQGRPLAMAAEPLAQELPEDSDRHCVVLTDKDAERGYAVHWGGPKPPYARADRIQLTLAADEYESVELGVLALSDIGETTLSLESSPPLPEAATRVQALGRISNVLIDDKGFGESEGVFYDYTSEREWAQWALLDGNRLTFRKGSHKSFWLILDTRKIKPGRYAINLRLQPTSAPARTVRIDVDVLDVRRVDDRQLPFPLIMRMYHTLSALKADGLDAHFKLLSDHYIRQLMLYFNSPFWANAVSTKLGDDGELETDFDGLASRVKRAIPYGIDTVALMHHLYNKQWLKPFADLPEERQVLLRRELARRLVQCLYDLGFNDVWMYTMDEPKVDYAVSEPVIEEFKEFRRVHPRLKFQISFNHYAPRMINALNPYIDVWTANSKALSVFQEDREQGRIEIDPTDQVGFYRGTYYIESPDLARSHGWLAAFWRCDHYTLFAYHQGFVIPNRQWVCFARGPDGLPRSTPGLEGAREGFEDFVYWRTLDYWVEQVGKLPEDRLSETDRRRLDEARNLRDKMFGHTDAALVHLGVETRVHAGGRPWPRIRKPNRWDYVRGKAALLEHIARVQRILAEHGSALQAVRQ